MLYLIEFICIPTWTVTFFPEYPSGFPASKFLNASNIKDLHLPSIEVTPPYGIAIRCIFGFKYKNKQTRNKQKKQTKKKIPDFPCLTQIGFNLLSWLALQKYVVRLHATVHQWPQGPAVFQSLYSTIPSRLSCQLNCQSVISSSRERTWTWAKEKTAMLAALFP